MKTLKQMLLFAIMSIATISNVYGQPVYVNNGSFETYIQRPTAYIDAPTVSNVHNIDGDYVDYHPRFQYLQGWWSPTRSSPDFYHAEARYYPAQIRTYNYNGTPEQHYTQQLMGTPYNWKVGTLAGYSMENTDLQLQPYADQYVNNEYVSGKGYAGVMIARNCPSYNNTHPNYREYLQTQLASPLLPGHTYCVTYMIALPSYNRWGGWQTQNGTKIGTINDYFPKGNIIQALLSNDKYQLNTADRMAPRANDLLLSYATSSFISRTNTWFTITHVFTNNTGQAMNYLTLGNFEDVIPAADIRQWYDRTNNDAGQVLADNAEVLLYMMIDAVGIKEVCDCNTLKARLEPTIDENCPNGCAYKVLIKNNSSYCYIDDVVSVYGSILDESPSVDWIFNTPTHAPFVFAPGEEKEVGVICVPRSVQPTNIAISYYGPQNSTCGDTLEASCPPPDCCAYLSFDVSRETSSDPTQCCYKLHALIDGDIAASPECNIIRKVRFYAEYPTGTMWEQDVTPVIIGNSHIEMVACFSRNQDIFQHHFMVEFLDENGNVICTRTATISGCQACCAYMSFDVSRGVTPDASQCCYVLHGYIDGDIVANPDCNIIRKVRFYAEYPTGTMWEESVAPIGGNTNITKFVCFSRNQDIYEHHFMIEFLDADGNVICTRTATIPGCQNPCCNDLQLTATSCAAAPENMCCVNLYARSITMPPCSVTHYKIVGQSSTMMPISLSTTPFKLTPQCICFIPGNTGGSNVFTVEFFNNGELVCTKTIEVPCGGGGGEDGSQKQNNGEPEMVGNTSALSIQPNPAATRATLHYTMDEAGPMSIKMFNATGQMIQTLEDTQKSKGSYSLDVDTSVLAVGVYHVELRANGRKLVVSLSIIR